MDPAKDNNNSIDAAPMQPPTAANQTAASAAAAGPAPLPEGFFPPATNQFVLTQAAILRYKSQRNRHPRPRLKLQPPLTPLIDVTFLLLLFFILTMQFTPPEGRVGAALPSAPGENAQQAAAINVPLEPLRVFLRTSSDKEVDIEVERYSGAIASFSALREVMQSLHDSFGSSDVPIIIQPSAGVSWQNALDAFRQAQLAGFKQIAFACKAKQ